MTTGRLRIHAGGIAVLLGAVLLLGGCTLNRFDTDVHFDTTYDWDALESFAFDVRREGVAESETGQILEAALRERITERGYREVPKEQADVLVSYDLGVYAAARLSGQNRWADVEGGITVWVFDAKTGQQIWYGWSERSLRPKDQPEPTIRAAVDAMFTNRLPDN